MAITRHGDQFIIDGLEAIRWPLNFFYRWQIRLQTWWMKLTRKRAKLDFIKSINLTGVRNVAIFALIEDRPDLQDYLADLKQAGYYLIVVANRLDVAVSEELRCLADALVFRENLGRDFGAYSDMAQKLYQLGVGALERVIFANDSMYYLKRTPDLFARLSEETEDYVAMTATDQASAFFCHAYLFQFSGDLFRDRRIIRYFERYIPISSARFAVFRGEMGLSRLVTNRLGRKPVLYFTHTLLKITNPAVMSSLERQMEWLGTPNTETLILPESRRELSDEEVVPLLWSIRDSSMVREAHTVEFLSRVTELDPSQQLALLFLRFGGFPFLKRNMFAKGFASYQSLYNELSTLPHGPDVLERTLRTYGSFYANPSWKRILDFATLWGYR